jgi:NTP-dependent ternary system trypsin peptidase co-occuring protein
MVDAIEFVLDDGTTVAVTSPPRAGSGAVGLGDRLETAQKTLREALGPVTAAAEQIIDGFRTTARRPEEIEVCFGVTLDGKLGGVIASANAGAHLDVTLRWHGSDAHGSDARASDARGSGARGSGAKAPDDA